MWRSSKMWRHFVCQGARVTLFAPPWLDEFFSIIQSVSNRVTADELSECHKTAMNLDEGFRKLNTHCVDLRPFFETEKFLSPLAFGKTL